MKHLRKPCKTGASTPPNNEARNHGNGAGTRIKRKSKPSNDSARPTNGKAADSRTKVVEGSRRQTIGIPFHATSPAKLAALTRLRDTHPGGSVRIQGERLEKALRRWPLTFQEMWALGLQDGRARIYGLKQRGLDITKVWVVIETEYGQRHRVGLYSLRRGGTVAAQFPQQPDLFRESACAAPAKELLS